MSGHPIDALPPRGKKPATARALQAWLAKAADETEVAPKRLNRTVANAIVISALQRVVHDDGHSRFLVKGGAHIELRLGLAARASADLDALFRGVFDDMIPALDEVLLAGWEPFTFLRGDPEVIEIPGRRVKPRRLPIKIQLRGTTVLTVQLEVAPDEAGAGERVDTVALPRLDHFGVETPERVAVLVMEYQMAQKFHACTDPHDDPRPNLRVHDLADLWLLRRAFFPSDSDLRGLRAACVAVFDARAEEAEQTGAVVPRRWPPTIVAYVHWHDGWDRLAAELKIDLTLDEVVTQLNSWIDAVATASGELTVR